MIFVSPAHLGSSDTLFGMNDLVAHSISSFSFVLQLLVHDLLRRNLLRLFVHTVAYF